MFAPQLQAIKTYFTKLPELSQLLANIVANTPDSIIGYADDETPAGIQNSSNRVFTLANSPDPVASLQLFDDTGAGLILLNQNTDYIIAANQITMGAAPAAADKLRAFYRY